MTRRWLRDTAVLLATVGVVLFLAHLAVEAELRNAYAVEVAP